MYLALLLYFSVPIITVPFLSSHSGSTLDLTPQQFWGIPVALLGAVLMSLGTQFQSGGLNKVERLTGKSAAAGLSIKHVLQLLVRPSWLAGTLLLGAAVGLQILALSLAPLIVVQPLGVVALVTTSILNSKIFKISLSHQVKVAIGLCVLGIVIFVAVAAFTARDVPVSSTQLTVILIVFAVVVVSSVVIFMLTKANPNPLIFIIGSGVLYGFVATFAKTIISRWQQDHFDTLTWIAVLALVSGAVLGMVYVQNAHSSGPPDLVIAGLTVVDPIIAVLIGIVILGEANDAPIWAFIVFVISGLIAMFGVLGISKFHPQMGKNALVEEVLERS